MPTHDPDALTDALPPQNPEIVAYYADKLLMWRNVMFIGLCNLGWGVVFGIVSPLMVMQLLDLGLRENIQGVNIR